MKYNFYKILFLTFASTFIYSCKKDDVAPNEGPALIDGLSTDLTIGHGLTQTINLNDYFRDKEGDTWETSSYTSSDTSVIKLSFPKDGNKQKLVLQAGKVGNAIVQLEFKDAKGQIVNTSFNIAVNNTAPNWRTTNGFKTSNIHANVEGEFTVGDSILDAEGDGWKITNATSSNTSVISVEHYNPGQEQAVAIESGKSNTSKSNQTLANNNPIIYYYTAAAGSATITFTLEDKLGAIRSLSFNVTVINDAPNWAAAFAARPLYVNTSSTYDLSANISDTERHSWYIKEVSSSNTAIINCSTTAFSVKSLASAFVAKEVSGFTYFYYSTGASTGSATITIVVADALGASRTLTFPVTVTTVPKEVAK